MIHERLINIQEHYRFPRNLVQCIAAFNTERQIHMAFDGESEQPVPFCAGLPQGFPLSPILFMIYSSTLDSRNGVQTTVYVDDEIARIGATTQTLAVKAQQNHLDQRIDRAGFLNIRYAPRQVELIHLIPTTSGQQINNADTRGIELYGTWIPPTDMVKILGVHIDKRLSFNIHAVAATANTRRSAGTLYQITRRKGASPASIHHLVKGPPCQLCSGNQKSGGKEPDTSRTD